MTYGIRVQVNCVLDDDDHSGFPGWVECEFLDAHGRKWTIVEKIPVVTTTEINDLTIFPQPGFVACTILHRSSDQNGTEILRVSTDKPWGIEASDGSTQFEISSDLLTKYEDKKTEDE